MTRRISGSLAILTVAVAGTFGPVVADPARAAAPNYDVIHTVVIIYA